MKIPFVALCALIVVSSLLVSVFLVPFMWDAAGYIENVLINLYPNPKDYLQ